MENIAIIGGGNLGVAIAEGMLNGGFIQPENITITRRKVEKLDFLGKKGVNVTNNNIEAISHSKYIFFAVKPFQIEGILKELSPYLDPQKHVIISVITGVGLLDLQSMTSHNIPIIRAMPNTAISIKQSMTCICGINCDEIHLSWVQSVFNELGESIIIDEALMDAATVLGACGTAFAMRFIRAGIQGGIEIGFDAKTATLIAAQTAKGAADLLLTLNTHPEQEIDKVTTPKGCTIAGLNEMEHQGFSSSLIKGISASYKKIKSDM